VHKAPGNTTLGKFVKGKGVDAGAFAPPPPRLSLKMHTFWTLHIYTVYKFVAAYRENL